MTTIEHYQLIRQSDIETDRQLDVAKQAKESVHQIIQERVASPLHRLAAVGRSVACKLWGMPFSPDDVSKDDHDLSIEEPVGPDFDWVMHSFKIVGLEDDAVVLKSIITPELGVGDTIWQQEHSVEHRIPLSYLSLSDRDFSTLVRASARIAKKLHERRMSMLHTVEERKADVERQKAELERAEKALRQARETARSMARQMREEMESA